MGATQMISLLAVIPELVDLLTLFVVEVTTVVLQDVLVPLALLEHTPVLLLAVVLVVPVLLALLVTIVLEEIIDTPVLLVIFHKVELAPVRSALPEPTQVNKVAHARLVRLALIPAFLVLQALLPVLHVVQEHIQPQWVPVVHHPV